MSANIDAANDRTAPDHDKAFWTALMDAQKAARYDFEPDTQMDLLAPETRDEFADDPLAHTLATMLSPSTRVLYTALDEPDADDVDGAKPGQTAPREPQTFVFAEPDDEDDALAIRVVDEIDSRYGEKLVVESPPPWETPDDMTPANDVIKSLSWDDHHRTFDDQLEAWTMDPSGLDPLREAAEDAGYDFEDVRAETNAPGPCYDDALTAAADFAEIGDHVTVRYAKKNGNGESEYAGEVRNAVTPGDVEYGHDHGVEASADKIQFLDSDDKGKKVSRDDTGVPSLYSSGYYPYMGRVLEVTVEPADSDA